MKENLMIFGGSILQKSIIEQVQKMGYNAIVIDPDENAMAKNIADTFYIVKGTDIETTLKIARENKIRGIITSATDKPILMMCRIADQLGFNFPTYHSCETLLDKGKFKRFLASNNFPHARGKEFSLDSQIENESFKYPVIIKPVMNSGSRGVIRCNNEKELLRATSETLEHSSDGRYIVEQFIEGDEISVEALVQDGKLHILQITDKIVTPPPYNVEMGHIQPSKYQNLKPELNHLLQRVVDLAGLKDCALHPELKIKDEKPIIIEIGPRLGGDLITSHLVPLSTGVNIEELLIDISLGKQISYKLENNASMISFLNLEVGKIVNSFVTEKEIKNQFPNCHLFHSDLKVGERIRKITDSLTRYGYFVFSDKDKNKLNKDYKNLINFINNRIERIL